jgi:hypothetical protein
LAFKIDVFDESALVEAAREPAENCLLKIN